MTQDSDRLLALLEDAKSVAREYREITGRPLGITGEIAEYEAARLLDGIELSPVRTPGFDATRTTPDGTERLQIKGRCLLAGSKPGQRIGKTDRGKQWDAVLLVLLNEDFDATAIYEAKREAVLAALEAPGSRARNERGALAVSKFKSIGRQLWPFAGSPPTSPRDTSHRLTRKSGVGMWKRAEEFAEAGRLFYASRNKGSFFVEPFVVYFLFAHSIELALKSFLVGQGFTERRLRKLRHDLAACLARSESLPAFAVKMSDDDRAVILTLSDYYRIKGYEYLRPGSSSHPMLEGVEGACFRLLEQTKPLSHQAARRAIAEEKAAEETLARDPNLSRGGV